MTSLPADPPIIEFPTVGAGPKTWGLSQKQLDSWRESYPAIDVLAECRKAKVWLEANPAKRKTAAGMARFLVKWLNRCVDRGGGSVIRPGGGVVTTPVDPVSALARQRYGDLHLKWGKPQ